MAELFEFPPTRSNRAKWALEELGIDYTSRIVDLRRDEHSSPRHRAIHPLGLVPALRTDTYTMFESVAIVMQLLDEYPERRLAPPPGSAQRAPRTSTPSTSIARSPPTMSDFSNAPRFAEYSVPM